MHERLASPNWLATVWWRWLGPAAALAAGIGFFGVARIDAPAPAIVPLCHLAATGTRAEASFLSDNDQAMTRMIADMTVQPTGDVDRDFVAMMVPHHQAAIEMAQALLRYGSNEPLRRLAQEIIVTQQQEIAAMRLALGEPLPPSTTAPDQPAEFAAPAAALGAR